MHLLDTRFAKHHLIGLAFWQAWQMVVLCTNAVIDTSTRTGNETLLLILMTTLGYLAVMVAHRFVPKIFAGRFANPIAAAFMSTGTFVLLLSSSIGDSTLYAIAFGAGLISVSYGNAVLLFMWGDLWSTLATGRVGRHLYLSYAFAFIPFFLSYALPRPWGGLFCCFFPIVSSLILSSCNNEPRRTPSRAPFKPERKILVKAIAFVIVLSVIWGLSQNLVPVFSGFESKSDFVAMGMVVAGAAIGAIALNLIITSPANEAITLYRAVVPAMVAGVLALSVCPTAWSFLGNGLLTMGVYCLDMFLMLVSTDLAFRAKMPASLAFGVAMVSSRIGTFIGSLLGSLALQPIPDVIVASGKIPPEALAICLAALAFASALLFTQADLQKLYETPYGALLTPTSEKDAAPLTTSQRCAIVAKAAGLTTRETEVIELLVRGRTIQGICEELSIAQGTAKHHVSNIYRKLGVGDRRSVYDLVESAKAVPKE